MNDMISALTLLTIIPVPGRWRQTTHSPGKSLAWFPAIGLLLGVILAAVLYLARAILPDQATAALVVALWAGLTGALHLEALADCGDGLAATASPERRQEIMHDPHVGAFGVVAVVLVLLVKFAAIASLRDLGFLVLSPMLARWAMVLAATFPLARNTGMAVLFRDGFGRWQLLSATVWAALGSAAFGWRGLVAFVMACTVVLLFAQLARNRLGGLNGDVYGAIGEVVEAVILVLASTAL
jgi:adenosylcobinamide-GDP ribazoletransferase